MHEFFLSATDVGPTRPIGTLPSFLSARVVIDEDTGLHIPLTLAHIFQGLGDPARAIQS